MTPGAALTAFVVAVALLTVTPGLDTMLVLRTAASEGRRNALWAAAGIQLGCLLWGAAVALGLGTLLLAAPAAYAALTWAGAAYLVWMGAILLVRPRRALAMVEGWPAAESRSGAALRRGLLTNLLNPKVGVFYVSFLPQFVPAGWPAGATVFGLAATHVGLATLWLALLVAGVGVVGPVLRRPAVVAWLDRATGAVFVAFGLRLVLARPA